MPPVEELTKEATDMVEGNRKLAERTKHDPHFGEGHRQENATRETQLESARGVAADYKKAFEQEDRELFALERKFTKGGGSTEELARMAKLRESVAARKHKLEDREARVRKLEEGMDIRKSNQAALVRDTQIAADHPVEHAIETVIAAQHLRSDDPLSPEAEDSEAALQRRVPAELKNREAGRQEMEKQKMAKAQESEDRSALEAVKEEFTALQETVKAEIERILAASSAQENIQHVSKALRRIQKLEGAFFKREQKQHEAKVVMVALENWFHDEFYRKLNALDTATLDLYLNNELNGMRDRDVKKPVLKGISAMHYYGMGPQGMEIGKLVESEAKALAEKLKQYHADFRIKQLPELLVQVQKNLGMPERER